MRYHHLRFDIWLCLLLSVLLAMGAEKIANKFLMQKYEVHKKEHKVDAGEIGGKATDDVYRAQNIEDILSHDEFTVISPGIEYRNKGAGYHDGIYLYALTLPSGERVAARINNQSVVSDSDSIFSGNSTLPVGRVIKENLSKDTYFIEQIEHSKPLTRKDFYIDMVGKAAIASEESFIEGPIILIQLLTVLFTFPIFHAIGSKIGIFPYIFVPKHEKKSEWE